MSTATPTPHPTPTGAVRPAGGGTIGHLLGMIPQHWLEAGFAAFLVFGVLWELERRHNSKGHRAITRAVSKGVKKSMKTKGQQQDEAVARFLGFVFGSLFRFLSGREMSGKPASNATFLRRGRRPLEQLLKRTPAMGQLGTIAIPERPVPAVPAGPSKAVERWRAWTAQQPLPGALGASVRRGGTVLVWTGGTLRGSFQGIAAAGGHARRTARAWGTWPHVCRLLVRLAVLAAGLGLWLRPFPTELALGGLVLAVLVAAATGPAGLALWHGVPRGDDEIYGPGLWAALRVALDLKDEEYHDPHLSLPADVRAEGAEITLLLPDHYAGDDSDKTTLDQLVNSRVPGEWVSRFQMMTRPPHVVWSHKPKPKPKPCPPDYVDFFEPEIQAAIARCGRGEVVIGRDEHGRIVTKKLAGATPHWGLSVATGGGKSAFNLMVLVQLIAQGYHIVIIDMKRISLKALEGVPGVHIYNDPEAPQDMRAAITWVGDEMKARSAVLGVDPSRYFPGLLGVIEEATELRHLLRAEYDEKKKSSDAAADPIWQQGVMSGANLGRAMWAHWLLVTQDLRDEVFGGKGMRNVFALKFLGSFTPQQWKNVTGITAVPDSIAKAGRMMMVEATTQLGWVQTCWTAPGVPVDQAMAAFRAWAIAKREAIDFDPEAGLFVPPPTRSAPVLPKALRAASRDKLPEAVWKALEGGSGDSDAGDAVTSQRHDATRDGRVPAQRDGSGEVPSEPLSMDQDAAREAIVGIYTDLLGRRQVAGLDAAPASWRHDATDAVPAPVNASELLTLAEISRRLEERGIIIKDGTMRKHKERRTDGERPFPAGTEVGEGDKKKTLYTMAEIVNYYQPEIRAKWHPKNAE